MSAIYVKYLIRNYDRAILRERAIDDSVFKYDLSNNANGLSSNYNLYAYQIIAVAIHGTNKRIQCMILSMELFYE